MNPTIIRQLTPTISGSTVEWRGQMVPPGQPAFEVWFKFTTPDATVFRTSIRPFLLACLPSAMRIGRPIRLEDPVDSVTLGNLMEWQEAMRLWRPKQLRVVPILCDVAPSAPRQSAAPGGAITAFSGGVDSCFTAFRHTLAPDEKLYRRVPLKAAMMVHGFDIPLDPSQTFDSAFARSERLLEAFGLTAFQLKTNLRALEQAFGSDWEFETHGIHLAAALSCYESFFDTLVIPSSYTYDILALPWGSNPVSDPLFGSDIAPVLHDGCAWDKAAKVRSMAHVPAIQRNLRVCWKGSELDRNCGRCYKCVATQAAFWLAGVSHPESFEVRCGLADVARLRVKKPQDLYLCRILQAEAQRQGMTSLAGALRRARIRGAAQRFWLALRRPKKWLKKL